MARPKKSPLEQRSQNLTVRFTQAERGFLDEQAHTFGVTVGELVRRRALKLPVVAPAATRKPSVNAALVSELNRVGVNVNQLAHAANLGVSERSHWRKLGDELAAILEKVVLAHGS